MLLLHVCILEFFYFVRTFVIGMSQISSFFSSSFFGQYCNFRKQYECPLSQMVQDILKIGPFQ